MTICNAMRAIVFFMPIVQPGASDNLFHFWQHPIHGMELRNLVLSGISFEMHVVEFLTTVCQASNLFTGHRLLMEKYFISMVLPFLEVNNVLLVCLEHVCLLNNVTIVFYIIFATFKELSYISDSIG